MIVQHSDSEALPCACGCHGDGGPDGNIVCAEAEEVTLNSS